MRRGIGLFGCVAAAFVAVTAAHAAFGFEPDPGAAPTDYSVPEPGRENGEPLGPPRSEASPEAVPPEYRPAPEFFAAAPDAAATRPPVKRRGGLHFPVHHAVFGEALGAGGFYSINYEIALGDVALRLGIGSIGAFRPFKAVASVPLGISYIGVGSGANRLELGAAVTFFVPRSNCHPISSDFCSERGAVNPTILAGYRYQSWEDGFFFRAGMGLLGGFKAGSGDQVVGVGEGGSVFVLWPYLGLGGTV